MSTRRQLYRHIYHCLYQYACAHISYCHLLLLLPGLHSLMYPFLVNYSLFIWFPLIHLYIMPFSSSLLHWYTVCLCPFCIRNPKNKSSVCHSEFEKTNKIYVYATYGELRLLLTRHFRHKCVSLSFAYFNIDVLAHCSLVSWRRPVKVSPLMRTSLHIQFIYMVHIWAYTYIWVLILLSNEGM